MFFPYLTLLINLHRSNNISPVHVHDHSGQHLTIYLLLILVDLLLYCGFLSVDSLRTTRIEASHTFAIICASVTAKIGGKSKITKSYVLYACARSSCIDFDPNNSAGFGGIGPHAKSADYQLMLFVHIFLNVHYALIRSLARKYYLLETFDASLVYAYLHQLIILSFLVGRTRLPYSLSSLFFLHLPADVTINECKFYQQLQIRCLFEYYDTVLKLVISVVDE